jgi:hypothetical protein
MTNRQTGKCRCGQVQFEVVSIPLITMVCHCVGCQRMTGSAFALSALYMSDEFKVTSGEPVIGGLHGATRHYFCPHCMSWVFTRPEGMDEFVNVRATLMDDARSFTPFLETYTDEMLPWAKIPAPAAVSRVAGGVRKTLRVVNVKPIGYTLHGSCYVMENRGRLGS